MPSREAGGIEVTTVLQDGGGATVFSSRESLPRGDAPAGLKNARIPLTKQIPLRNIRPGQYTLRVQARFLGAGSQPVARESAITIVP